MAINTPHKVTLTEGEIGYILCNLENKTVNLTLTFDERSELLKHLEMFDEHIDQLHPLVESVQDKLLGID